MAIKEQCSGCLFYNTFTSSCDKYSSSSLYNNSSCESYQSKRFSTNINLDKGTTAGGNSVVNNTEAEVKTPKMFSNVFSFKGRIRRLEYGLTFLIYCIWLFILSHGNVTETNIIFYLILFIPVFWIFVAQSAKRCHDLGDNGWWQLVPLYNLMLLFVDGYEGVNEYGPSPK